MDLTRFASVNQDDVAGLRIGDLLRRGGYLTAEQADEIAYHAETQDLRFGEAALVLGYVDGAVLEQALAAQFEARSVNSHIDEEVAVVRAPNSRAAEDYRSLRSTLALRWFRHPEGAPTLAVVSPQRFEGRSLVCANLAASFAQVGFRTLLIDADMRNPRQEALFQVDDRVGLSDYLAGRTPELSLRQVIGLPSLSILPVGPLPSNPQELLLRNALPQMVSEARSLFDIILFDTPAASIGNDYQLVGKAAQGVLVVTNRRQTRVKDAAQMVNQLHDSGVPIVGSTMTGDS